MTQTGDYSIANASGSSVRGDINETLINILETNSGGSAPSFKRTGTLWLDTSVSPNMLRIYNGSGWLAILDMSGTHYVETGNGSFVQLGQNGTIEMCSLNGTPYFDFKRTSANNNDWDWRIIQSGDTNYDLKIKTGGALATPVDSITALGTGAALIGNAGVGGTRTGGTGGIPSGCYQIGVINFRGFNSRSGYAGSNTSNVMNFAWVGTNLQAWVDSINVGTVSFTSDYRVKKNITTQTASGIEKVKQLRPVNYEYADNNDFGFKGDGVEREGFIAHEVAEVIPSGCEGAKDAENQIQSLKIDAIVSVLTKALQEAVAKIETLETKVAALEAK